MQHNKKQNTARLLALLLTTVMFFGVLAFAVPTVSAAASGYCGRDLVWTYNAGTLTITGTGAMHDYRETDPAPWDYFRESILRIVLSSDITNIGNRAFYGCTNLKTVTIPDKVTSVGAFAFAYCEGLESVRFGKKVSSVGNASFYGCSSLDSIKLPISLQSIGPQAFFLCESLTAVVIPLNVSTLGSSAFSYCTNLIRADIEAPITVIPEWIFYGCEKLVDIILPKTVENVEQYAFKNCNDLATIYFNGSNDKKTAIEVGIRNDLPEKAEEVYVSSAEVPVLTGSQKTVESEDGFFIKTDTTVKSDDNMTIVSTVETKLPSVEAVGGNSVANVKVSVENSEGWESAEKAVKDALKEINKSYASTSNLDKVDVTVYVKEETPVAEDFVKEMAGREVEMTVVTQNGSTYRVDCSDVKREELSGSYNYSYNVTESTEEINTKLGTENCYQVSFTESAQINAEVLVKLPEDAKNSNAFLYQIEDNGEYTRLQAVAIDNDNNAHFYLASVDKDTQYVIGVDVPGEKTDDVIIPDELFSQYGNAVERLERIEYVITGRQSSWGLNMMQVTWILLAVLVVCIVIVGVVMTIIHKKRLISGYYEKKMLLYEEGEDFDDDEDEDEDEEE